jgi:hypothetical protein
MTAEIFKLALPGRFFVFVATQNVERLNAFERALGGLGARVAPKPSRLSGIAHRQKPYGMRLAS